MLSEVTWLCSTPSAATFSAQAGTPSQAQVLLVAVFYNLISTAALHTHLYRYYFISFK